MLVQGSKACVPREPGWSCILPQPALKVIILYGGSITGCLVDSREGNVPSLVGGSGVNIWRLCVKHNMPQVFKSTLKNKEFLHQPHRTLKLRQLGEGSGFTDRKPVQGAAGRAPKWTRSLFITAFQVFKSQLGFWGRLFWREINQAEFITLYGQAFLSMNMDILLSLLGVLCIQNIWFQKWYLSQ